MVKFPKHFVQLDRYPGYYWNTEEKHLYSIKVTGILHKLVKGKGFVGHTRYGYINCLPGWTISQCGSKRRLSEAAIELIVKNTDLSKKQKVPVESYD